MLCGKISSKHWFPLAVKGEDTLLPLFQQVNGPQPF